MSTPILYNDFPTFLRKYFSYKVQKISLNAGFTCPNRDGTKGWGGCTYCNNQTFNPDYCRTEKSITTQLQEGKYFFAHKYPEMKYLAYFQAYTNTYAPVDYLEKIFTEALSYPDVVAISIGTRPDCLGDDVIALLKRLNQIKPVWVELGLQTMHEETARYIRRGYSLSCFETAVKNLKEAGLEVIVHTILGLPGESKEDILETIDYLNHKDIQGIKLQLLHVLKGTDLASDYLDGKFKVYSMEEYIDLVISCLERLSPDIVVHRVTGDGPKALLIAPLWSSAKKTVLNTLHHECKIRNTWQGRLFHET